MGKKRKCAKCGKRFKLLDIADGETRPLYGRKYCLNCSPFRHRGRRSLGLVDSTFPTKDCQVCGETKPNSQFYKRNDAFALSTCCKDCQRRRGLALKYCFKRLCVNYKGGKCVNCGYNKCLTALDFHHTDPTTKSFNIGRRVRKVLDDRTKVELDKCILLCSNCHREIHFQGYWEVSPLFPEFLSVQGSVSN